MSFTAKYFHGTITGGDANHNYATGSFTATITADANDVLSGTWTFSGSYIASDSTGPNPYVLNGSGNISFSGTLTGSLVAGLSNTWKVFFNSSDSRFDAGDYGFMDRVNGVYDLDPSIGFTLPFTNYVKIPITEHFGAFTNNLPATSSLPPIVSIDHYTSVIDEDGGNVSVTLSRSGADLGSTSTVFLSTEDGAAVSTGLSIDFNAANAIPVVFAAGITTRTIVVTRIIDDQIMEANENFHIRIANPDNATIGFGFGDIVITDNDKAGTTGADVLTGSTTNDSFFGGAGNDTMNGGAGRDTSVYSGNRANFTVTKTSTGFTVKDNVGNEGTDTLTSIERLQFADRYIALDLDGSAGQTAKILGAVFGPASLSNKVFVGIGLSLLDSGTTYENLMSLALSNKLGVGFSNTAEVNLLFQNLTGAPPTAGQLQTYVHALEIGQYTQTSLALMAADLALNATNINLVGLAQTGIEYTL